MSTAKTIDLVQERGNLEKVEPALAESYKAFVSSYSDYRRIERRLNPPESGKEYDQVHLARPAAVSGLGNG